MSILSFNEMAFRTRIDEALKKVRTILDNTKSPQLPADVPHEYDDKYILAEVMTSTAVGAYLASLEAIGLTAKDLERMQKWSKTHSVTLRLKAEETCKFLRKVVREEESDTSHVTTWTGGLKRKDVVVTKVTEYFWDFNAKYELVAFEGNQIEKALTIVSKAHNIELKTSSETTPYPASTVRPNVDVNITWLLQQVDRSNRVKFTIDRNAKSCHTPRRNDEVTASLRFDTSFSVWAMQVHSYFSSLLFPVQKDHGLDLTAINAKELFDPVLPLFDKNAREENTKPREKRLKGEKRDTKDKKAEETEERKEENKKEETALIGASSFEPRDLTVLVTPRTLGSVSKVVPLSYINPFLAEQKKSIDEKFAALAKVFAADVKLITKTEAEICTIALHIQHIAQSHSFSVDYVEDMLYKQLVAAIGKTVTPVDFTNFMRFHERKLYRPEYQPRPFCYAIRRPEHYPEGVLSIEANLADGSNAEPITTTVCAAAATHPMHFPLNAATKVSFLGDRYLHGWVSHQFSGQSGLTLQMVARARQFSSFILLIGRIAGADLFEPNHAIIIQNKDDLRIPLLLETIPSPKEFRDAIESLSPEQQRFAKAFRSMQLESTLFGVCVIQIKPQMEKLLRLPNDSLTKEIQLTQDLMNLFLEYQIPSDLISYDGDEDALVHTKLATVKTYVSNMQAMIAKSKEKELEEERQRQSHREAELDIAPQFERYEEKPRLAEERKYQKEKRRKIAAPKKKGAMLKCSPASAPQASYSAAAPLAQERSITTPKPEATASVTPAPKTPSHPSEAPQSKDVTTPRLSGIGDEVEGGEEVVDYTKVPAELEGKFDELDEDHCLRPTIINPGPTWEKKYQNALLAPPKEQTLNADEQRTEQNKTFDLLDALSRSGALTVDAAELHVVIAATHCFDQTLLNTIIRDNVNPIEKVERSSLIVASTIHNAPVEALIQHEQVARIEQFSPMLLTQGESEESGEADDEGKRCLGTYCAGSRRHHHHRHHKH